MKSQSVSRNKKRFTGPSAAAGPRKMRTNVCFGFGTVGHIAVQDSGGTDA